MQRFAVPVFFLGLCSAALLSAQDRAAISGAVTDPAGALVPTAHRMELPIGRFREIDRWYESLSALPAWCDALAARDAATAAWFVSREKPNVNAMSPR